LKSVRNLAVQEAMLYFRDTAAKVAEKFNKEHKKTIKENLSLMDKLTETEKEVK
jgi:hypothetical protein